MTGSGPNYASTVSMDGPTNEDKLTFGTDGTVNYQSNSSDRVRVDSTSKSKDGSYNKVSVEVEGSAESGETVEVKVERGEDGKAKIEVDGVPEGKEVTVEVETKDRDGNETTDAAAGFGVQGCVPNDNIGFCLGASLNIVALHIKYQLDRALHWMYGGQSGEELVRKVGSWGFSIPWSLKILEGAVQASAHFLWTSVEWVIVSYDGFTVAEGKLYDTTVQFSEDFGSNR